MPDGDELSGVGRTSGARDERTEELMKEAVKLGKCGFCSPYFEEKNGERVILLEEIGEPLHWKIWHTVSPYDGTSYHILMAPNRHVMFASELTQDEILERQELVDELRFHFGYVSFSELSRQGDPDFNSATVFHLHYHLVVSSGEPASVDMIPDFYLGFITELFEVLALKAVATGEDPFEVLDKLRGYIDVFRAAKLGKAVPVRAKFSNKVGTNHADSPT